MNPPKPLVVFDGQCEMCRGSLSWLERLDWFSIFDSAPYQDKTLYAKYPALHSAQCAVAIHVLFPDGRLFDGADAIREIGLRLPMMWVVAIVMAIPPFRQIARGVYANISRHRQQA